MVLVSSIQVFHRASAYHTENEFKELQTILHSIVHMVSPSGLAQTKEINHQNTAVQYKFRKTDF